MPRKCFKWYLAKSRRSSDDVLGAAHGLRAAHDPSWGVADEADDVRGRTSTLCGGGGRGWAGAWLGAKLALVPDLASRTLIIWVGLGMRPIFVCLRRKLCECGTVPPAPAARCCPRRVP